jgi:flagellar biosynthesis chaperone FliJ
MKRFSFRLERVLRLKRQRERQAELRQRQIRSQVEGARMQLRITQERMMREASELAGRTAQSLAAELHIAAVQYLTQVHRHVEVAEAQVRKTEQLLQEANNQRATIHREVESLVFLRRVKWQEHQRDTAQATQQQLDDMSLRRWQFEQTNHKSALFDLEAMG